MNDYAAFLQSKVLVVLNAGIDIAAEALHPALFPFQRDLFALAGVAV